jgi:hypothetical protein
MMYPLVRELAGDGISVTMTCRGLKIARQPYYRWLSNPVTDAEHDEAYLANAIFEAHRNDPEFGYRFLVDEVRQAGHEVCDRTVSRICHANGCWSVGCQMRRRLASHPPHGGDARRSGAARSCATTLGDSEFLAEHATVDGDITKIGSDAWVIHGHIPVDGDVIMAAFGSFEEASAALGGLPPNERDDLGEP